ncbi:hypothetical protein ElyMa_003050000 [Elysia marginata]|uniref:Uncharacterized protein n=1 Tax=Elysia marginata TaxID=1093978 RepID=A0AAV4IEH2_9GAST|nr:hypothetical protein ElyMa_003050000 [Elysia marginata]
MGTMATDSTDNGQIKVAQEKAKYSKLDGWCALTSSDRSQEDRGTHTHTQAASRSSLVISNKSDPEIVGGKKQGLKSGSMGRRLGDNYCRLLASGPPSGHLCQRIRSDGLSKSSLDDPCPVLAVINKFLREGQLDTMYDICMLARRL